MNEVFLRLRYPEDVQLISQAMGALHAQIDALAERANQQIKEVLAARSARPEPSGVQNGAPSDRVTVPSTNPEAP